MLALEATVSAISYITIAVFLGQLVAAGFLLPQGQAATLRTALLIWARASLLLFLFAALLTLLVQGAKLQHAFPSAELLWRYLTMTQSGKTWFAREVYGVILLFIMWPLPKKNATGKVIRLVAVLTLPLVAARSLTSHAAAVRDDTAVAVIADAIHLIATALWAGGLVALWSIFYFGRQNHLSASLTAQVVQRFSRLALASFFLLLATGAYQSWIHVGSLNILLNTQYGNVLALKLALFLAMFAFGTLNFLSTKQQLSRWANTNDAAHQVGQRAFKRIGAESLLGLSILSVTGLLTVLPPGVHALHQAAAAKMAANAASGAAPAAKLEAPEGARVKILSPTSEQVFAGDKVPLKFALTKGKRGQHVHAYVDGELMGMFESRQGTLNGIVPGRHILELRVVTEDHQTELDAADRVEFIVK
jgi:putative copper export protein